MKFVKFFGEGCKELGMGVKPTKDGVEITPTIESMDKLIAFMGGIPAEPEASRGEQGNRSLSNIRPGGMASVRQSESGSAPRNPESLTLNKKYRKYGKKPILEKKKEAKELNGGSVRWDRAETWG